MKSIMDNLPGMKLAYRLVIKKAAEDLFSDIPPGCPAWHAKENRQVVYQEILRILDEEIRSMDEG